MTFFNKNNVEYTAVNDTGHPRRIYPVVNITLLIMISILHLHQESFPIKHFETNHLIRHIDTFLDNEVKCTRSVIQNTETDNKLLKLIS